MISYLVFTSKEIKCNQNSPCSALCHAVAWHSCGGILLWSLSAQQLPISSMTSSNNGSCAGFWLHLLLRTPECQCSQGWCSGWEEAQYCHCCTGDFGGLVLTGNWGLKLSFGSMCWLRLLVLVLKGMALAQEGDLSSQMQISALEGQDLLSGLHLEVFLCPGLLGTV